MRYESVILMLLCTVLMAIVVQGQSETQPLPQGTTTVDTFGLDMVYVPSGSVIMGIEENEYISLITDGIFSGFTNGTSIGPVRATSVFATYEAYVHGFWIDVYELSISDYDRITSDCRLENTCSESRLPQLLTWDEAVQFCAIRNARLPMENEWEYAASGPDNYIFPWGNDLEPELLENDSYTSFSLYEVGTKSINVSWSGVFDMAGNAAEWTDDIYMPYEVWENTDFTDWFENHSEFERVIRGGAAEDGIMQKTTYSRQSAFYGTAGVRCVRYSNPSGI